MSQVMRTCEAPWCRLPLKRREQEQLTNFERRKYCHKSCAAKHANYLRNRRRNRHREREISAE